MSLRYLVQNTEKCDELLYALNSVVEDYEYGLPLHDENMKARMREVLYVWASTEAITKPESAE